MLLCVRSLAMPEHTDQTWTRTRAQHSGNAGKHGRRRRRTVKQMKTDAAAMRRRFGAMAETAICNVNHVRYFGRTDVIFVQGRGVDARYVRDIDHGGGGGDVMLMRILMNASALLHKASNMNHHSSACAQACKDRPQGQN
eukprot:10496079-Lingulodinium_polyedra.AAC.1